MTDIYLLDIRRQQTPTGPKGACKLAGGKMLMRDPASVDTLLGHQTACFFGVSPRQIRQAGGDAALAQFMRAKDVHAQVTAFDEGTFVAAYPLLAYVYAANGGSGRSISLESEGLYNGKPGGKRAEPSDLVIETTRAAATWIVSAAAEDGALVRFYDAHRKHSASRRGDPGWRFWQAVYVDHCERRLGLKLLDGTTRDGRPIPLEWDPRSKALY